MFEGIKCIGINQSRGGVVKYVRVADIQYERVQEYSVLLAYTRTGLSAYIQRMPTIANFFETE
ncbi:hypothetical protein Mapa_007308 [Marchantia paleacea]|nr:hypothetical protein Mapa_007308 [Marchantia paleacea]